MANAHGVLVVDCGDLSGAFCARVLAGLGARVVRRPVADGWHDRDPDAAAFYAGGAERPARAAGADAIPSDLLDAADVIVTTGRSSDLQALGLDYEHLSSRRRELVVVNISPFGLGGPHAEWRGGNLVATAAGGMLYVNGWPGEPPQQPLGLQAYHVAGIQGATGALLALRVRDRDRVGQLVDISLQESVLASLEHVTGMKRETGAIARRAGTLHWTRSFQTVMARDAEILATHIGDWDALSAWVSAELEGSTLADQRWRSLDYRREHCEELFEEIATWASRYRATDLVEQAQLRRLPFAPVNDLHRASCHPQLEARGFFAETDIGGATRRVPRRPLPLPTLEDALATPRPAAPEPRAPTPDPALAGVRVLDLTWVVAGPAATRVLADHGAEVIKVEHPDTASPGPRRGGLFGNLNRGKKSIVLDLRSEAGLDTLRRLVRCSDVLVENFSPRVLANWNLDDAALHQLNPRLTIVHMSGFGRSGPLSDWVSYGPTLQSQLGFTAHMRRTGGRAAGWGYSFSDMVSGQVAALAAIAALRAGGGRVVDLSQLEVLASIVGPALIAAANGDAVPPAIGNLSQEGEISPHGVYRCRDASDAPCDRWCAIAVEDERQWRALAEVMGLLLPEARELDVAAHRLRRAAEVDGEIARWMGSREAESVVSSLQAAGVPSALVANGRDLLDDEHLRERGMWSRTATPEGPAVELDATPIRLSSTPGAIRAPGPLLNEHGTEILRMLAERETGERGLRGGAGEQ